jgi:hypothetical protein
MTTDEFRRAVTKDTFRPCRLLLADGQEIHVLSHNDYGLSSEGTLLMFMPGLSLKQIKPAEVERVEPLPYRVINEDRSDIAKARKALAEIRRRDLIPQAEVVRLLGLALPEGGGK